MARFRSSEPTAAQWAILLFAAAYVRKAHNFPSTYKIAARFGISHQRAQWHLTELEAKNYIIIEDRERRINKATWTPPDNIEVPDG